MSKFCHECGAQLFDDTAKFCSECGATTIKDSELSDISDSSNNKTKRNSHSLSFGVMAILLGLAIIFMIYTLPIFNISGRYYSLSTAGSRCLVDCSFYYALFFIGWIVAIISIIYGLIEIILAAKK